MLQQGGVAAAEAAPLRGEPAVEDRAAVDLQAFEEVAGEQRGTALAAAPAQASRCPPAVARAISTASTKQSARSSLTVSPRVSTRRRPGSSRRLLILLRHQRSSPRGSFGHVPQQLAQLAARHGVRRKRQIGEQRAHLARCRQRQRDAVAADRQRPEQPHLRARAAAGRGPADPIPRAFPRRLPRSPPRVAATLESTVTARASDPTVASHGQGDSTADQPPERRTIMATSAAAISQNRAARADRPRGAQGAPAGRLVVRRLRRRRHHPADRRRGAVRGARPARRPEGARRRRRQRQRLARRRAPLVRRDRHRLRAGAARARPRARRGRAARRSSSARPTPRRCRSPTAASTSSSRPSA